MNKLKKEALFWKEKGISTIPIHWKTKYPEIDWLRYAEFLPTDDEIEIWFASDLHNIGIITGWRNLVIVDFDNIAWFSVWRNWIAEQSAGVKAIVAGTRIVRSARGAHVYVYTERECENMKLEGIDILACRKYALTPPSIHPSGKRYEFENAAEPMTIEQIGDIIPAAWLDAAKVDPCVIPGKRDSSSWSDLDEAGRDKDVEGSYSLVDEIKRYHRIEDYFVNVRRSKNSRWLMTKCPFHDDHNESFWIDTDSQVCGCFAGCTRKPLDVIGLYARTNQLTNSQAIDELRVK